ncbi:MAG: hypothetical protein JWR90_2481 [Marmoricola sp.]|jgi:hypothetical protein|nr:hypothetical protein [Marmoricola sp.]
MTTADPSALDAAEAARAALVEQVGAEVVGEHLDASPEEEGVVTHRFASREAGYPDWVWAVTVARAPGTDRVTIDEIVMLPGENAIIAPVWVPWRERIQPGDLSPGDLLPTDEDDPRLVPAYLAGDLDEWERAVVEELGLGRSRVLSLEGRELAAQRWYEGDQGPDSPMAQSAPGRCEGCGFLVRLAGPLSETFGVCANEFANDDGRVVTFNHGCGAHSEAQLRKKQLPPPLPDHVFDSLSVDDFEQF